MYVPGWHVMAVVQLVWPLSPWNEPSAHAEQDSALEVSVNVPASQSPHWRSEDAVRSTVTCVPDRHVVAERHDVWLLSGWYESESQDVHEATLLAVEYVPARQTVQVRSVVLVTLAVMRSPGAHVRTW